MSNIILGGSNNNVTKVDIPSTEAKVVTVGNTAVWCNFPVASYSYYALGNFLNNQVITWTGPYNYTYYGGGRIDVDGTPKHSCTFWQRMWVTKETYFDLVVKSWNDGGWFESNHGLMYVSDSNGDVLHTLTTDAYCGGSMNIRSTLVDSSNSFRLIYGLGNVNGYNDSIIYNNADSYKAGYPKIYYAAIANIPNNAGKVSYHAFKASYA